MPHRLKRRGRRGIKSARAQRAPEPVLDASGLRRGWAIEVDATLRNDVRPARNRPTLITSSTPTDSMTEDQPEQVPSDTSQPAEARVDTRSPSPTGTRKLPGFFSRVGKSTQPETPEAEGAGELKDAPQASPRASTAATSTRIARRGTSHRHADRPSRSASTRSCRNRARIGLLADAQRFTDRLISSRHDAVAHTGQVTPLSDSKAPQIIQDALKL